MGLIGARGVGSFSTKELAARLGLPKGGSAALRGVLEELQLEGRIVEAGDGRWADPKAAGMVVGRLSCHPRGFGFVAPVTGEGEDVYVAPRGMADAVHGDTVLLECRPPRGGRRGRRGGAPLGPSGRVVQVLRRANQRLTGSFSPGRRAGLVRPDNPSLTNKVIIPRGREAGAKKGEKVAVNITKWPDGPAGELVGSVTQVLGRDGDPGVDEQTVIVQFNLPQEFPAEALREGQALPEGPSEEDKRDRRDFRGRLTITIDPATARDRDDGLSIYRDPRTGARVVLVHIADVSHHVPPGGPLDEEARRRALSVYLVSDFIPMLPKRPTQQVLSLAEGRDRLAKTVVLEFDDEAGLIGSSIHRSVVHTDRVMTYAEVAAILEAADSDEETASARQMAKWSPPVWDAVTELDRLARQLRARRRDRGSVDLDVPEYDVRVDEEGRVTAVSQIERDRSHDLVEEFMLSANCVVAAYLRERKLPGIYRTHEEPDEEDLAAFAEFVLTVMEKEIDTADRGQLQDLVAEVSGTNLSEAVSMELLRCMKRALYQPAPGLHFALNYEVYCHFTSPIRRYADLVVHQILDQHFAGELKAARLRSAWGPFLPAVAKHCSQAERRADDAEREIVKIKLLRFLQEHGGRQGEVFDAVITGVQEYGAFAQLVAYSVEGLIKVAGLKGDFYRYHERRRALVGSRTGRTLSLGQRVQVVIENIDLPRRQMDLALVETALRSR